MVPPDSLAFGPARFPEPIGELLVRRPIDNRIVASGFPSEDAVPTPGTADGTRIATP